MKYFLKIAAIINYSFLIINCVGAQTLNQKQKFTHQDTLRGSIGSGRDWWDVMRYDIDVIPDYNNKTITGNVWISFRAKPGTDKIMQIDLQEPLIIDSITPVNNIQIKNYRREGNVYFIDFGKTVFKTASLPGSNSLKTYSVKISYHGKPREAVNPPWDGGWIWKKDAKGNPWMSVACQGLGASVWYPCKDHQSDEPELGASLSITVPDSLSAIGNGNLIEKKSNNNGTNTWVWEVKNPINNYNIIPYIGKYTNWSDIYDGEKGKLNCNYWVLDYNIENAKNQFGRDVHRMLKAFEYWFGPYPFYEDGYKLIESPHLGMEHQSATAYGNKFQNGYSGNDLSGTGWGLKWDFIIIHESGHEWFANNITSKDLADMWIHESFTAYSETLFTQYYYGNEAGNDYVIGTRKRIKNDTPVIGVYGVNQDGSGDMYYKGSNLLHTIRQVINDDSLFRKILRGLNTTYYHQTVTTKQIEDYISKMSHRDLSQLFNQYLRTSKIPELEYKIAGKKLSYRWSNSVPGFNMPVKVNMGDEKERWIKPTSKWQQLIKSNFFDGKTFIPNRNFLIETKKR